MAELFLMVLGPVFAGVVLAFVWWFIRGRKNRIPRSRASAFSLAAGLLLVFGGVAARLTGVAPLWLPDVPNEFWRWFGDFRFAVPLALGILGMVLLALPVRARGGHGSADLTPRTALSFARGWWFVTPAVTLVLTVAITVAAGAVSQPDPESGHYTMYFVDLGGERGMGTNIYGWFNSVPSLILMGIMIVVAIVNLVLITRPALDSNQERDVRTRTVRSRNALAVATGALLLHVGIVLGSLAGTASVRSSFAVGDGTVSFWTTFAALEPVLRQASVVAAVVGFAFWAAVALSAIPSRREAAVGS